MGKVKEPVLNEEQFNWMVEKIFQLYADDEVSEDFYNGFLNAICCLHYDVINNPGLKKYIRNNEKYDKKLKEFRELCSSPAIADGFEKGVKAVKDLFESAIN